MSTKSKSKSKKRDIFSLFGWAIAIAGVVLAVKAFHSYQAISVTEAAGQGVIQKKKEDRVKINSLGGGSRPSDYEKQKAYYGGW